MDPLTILWGVLVLAGLGLLLGFALAFAAKMLHVEEDKRIKAVEDMLPGANCGACGYAGCHDLAEALVNGDAKKVSACKVGKKEKNFDPIVAYMKETPGPDGNIREVSL